MRLATAVCVAAVVVCTATACGSDDGGSDAPRSGTASAHSDFDDAKSAAFVASFKAAFPELAEGRSDGDITQVLDDTCEDLREGDDEQSARDDIKSRAENGNTEPTDNQARQIYEMAQVACP